MTETTMAPDTDLDPDDELGNLDADDVPPPLAEADEEFEDPDYDPANDQLDPDEQGESLEAGEPGALGEEETGDAPEEPGEIVEEPSDEGGPFEPGIAGGPISLKMSGPFIAAKGYRKGRRGNSVRWISIHTAEGARDEVALGKFFRGTTKGSSNGGAGQGGGYATFVNYKDTAWTNPPLNEKTDTLEICGFAKWKRAQWLAQPKMLETVAKWIAWRCAARGIPIRRVTGAALRNGAPGIVGHKDVNDVFKMSSHWDPGPNFPWDVVLTRARQLAGLTPLPKPTAAIPAPPSGKYTVKAGDSYWKIAQGAYRNGNLWPAIAKANGNKPLQPGMVLTIPPKPGAATKPAGPAKPATPKPAPQPAPKAARLAQTLAKPAIPAWPGTSLVAGGKRNGHVHRLQQRLIAKGFKIPAGATGFYGDQTKSALAAFQKKHPPTWPADGKCGPVTWRLLFS